MRRPAPREAAAAGSPDATAPQTAEDDTPDEGAKPGTDARPARFSRRALLGGAVGAASVLAGGSAAGFAAGRATAAPAPAGTNDIVPFTGGHQAGITTPVQEHLHFAAFDLTTDSRDDVVALLRRWTLAADRMTRGLPAGPHGTDGGPYDAPPDDTGEAEGLAAANLTVTIGFGPTMFTTTGTPDGADRFGLADRRPAPLENLPHFPADMLEDARTGGDLAVQACADDPQVAVHAVRNLARLAFGTATVRWSQLGYGRTSRTTKDQSTPRNLFGFKDGTANIVAEDHEALADHVWVAPGDDAGADWLAGGSYLVARRIRMTVETWDRTSLREQENVVGRTKGHGAPLSGGSETTAPDFTAAGSHGPLVPADSHVALAHPSANDGARLLRRGYNYTDGSDGLGKLDAGLFFIAFVRDPARQYIPMQNRISRSDTMMEYLRHTGSGLWAVPPAVPAGSTLGEAGAYLGQELFEA
ncbi:iron uptake transporter deferrochelatase/peroxidase subunit [Myceligenerans indicum]|uniref:Deferrochelatase n=1 Tax=Myceligenerans indicum TaxID=2593663 RepID=A0ABS1LGF1_9MICO|nr:iron uptake transporter deferrochelatase/peroxidase subunit [Myceligenerans indicum]MBL0885292.1 deferrochelatase/peroxidase EfeB [Myceligenerans indicum]